MKSRNLWLNVIMAVLSLALAFFTGPALVGLIQNFGSAYFTPVMAIATILILSCAIFAVFRSLVFKKFDKPMWIIASLIYVVLMVAALFFKGQSQGVNFDLSQFFDQWNNGSYIRAYLVGNCLAFVPYPLLLHFWGVRTKPWRALLLFLAIESLQLALTRGAFDVYDLAAYLIGYLAGYVLLIVYLKIGVPAAFNFTKGVTLKKTKAE